MKNSTAYVRGIGWVLPAGVGSGPGICTDAKWLQWKPEDNRQLADFSAKPFLRSVKGYLDPASAYLLAASVLALGKNGEQTQPDDPEHVGISTVSRYGATLSGYRFYDMFVQKGPRLASPLVFPHGYSNTPGNLAAIEFGFGGPHLVLYGKQDVREAVGFALTRLAEGSAHTMLVGCYESAEPTVLPDNTPVHNGAVAVVLCSAESSGCFARFSREDLWAADPADRGLGTVHAALALLQALPV